MADPIRIYCDDPDYGDTWIDVSPRWTQREMERLLDVRDEDFWKLLSAKTVACNIQTEGGAITDPAELTAAGLAEVDVLLIGWLGSVLPLALAKRRALGNASARLSLLPNGTGRTTNQTTAAPNPTTTT